MRRLLAAFAVIFMLLLVSVYVFIPSKLIISKVTVIACTRNGAYRILSDKNTWVKWWPDYNANSSLAPGNNTFAYKKYSYSLTEIFLNSVKIHIGQGILSLNSDIDLIPIRNDSVAAEWQCKIGASRNPIKRISQYLQAIDIKNNMTAILESLRSFLEVKSNVYGIAITETSTKDTLLMATKSMHPYHPANSDIYHSVGILKSYINSANAKVTGSPMVNITPLPNGQFEMMVAIPTDRKLKGTTTIFFRKMIPGNFLVSEAKGGNNSVAEAETQMQHFMDDYEKTSMAIPFEVLITDRDKETDSSKWVTKIYFPVMK